MNSISELIAQLGGDDQAKVHQTRQNLIDMACKAGRPGNAAGQTEFADAVAAELTATTKTKSKDGKEEERPKNPVRVRNGLCQLLSRVATDSHVPALAAALTDREIREMARWGLDRLPGEASTKALVSALEQVGPEFRVGVINALSKRKGSDVQAALLRATADGDNEVRLAAVEALANFAEPSNDEPIVAATKTGLPRERTRAQKARVRLADSLRLAGKKDAAVAIYKAIMANDADEPQKKAARLALEQLT